MEKADDDIDLALGDALLPRDRNATRKLVFAGAHNNVGNNGHLGWPGKREGVIAIYATNGRGYLSDINPQTTASPCFGTLGMDIQMGYRRKGEPSKNVYLSGASYATPIAAGIAANILEIARHDMPDMTDEAQRCLRSSPSMKAMLERISEPGNDGFYYLQPWKFWNEVSERAVGDGRDSLNVKVMKVLRNVL